MRSLLGLLFALILCLASSAASGAGGDAATTDLAAFERLLAGYGDSCAEEGQTFYCPNCGGIELTDCLECNGFLNTGEFCVKKVAHDVLEMERWQLRLGKVRQGQWKSLIRLFSSNDPTKFPRLSAHID